MRVSIVSSLLAVALPWMAVTGCSDKTVASEPVRAVRTVELASAPAGIRHEYAGEVRARTESQLGFRVGGKLLRRPVELGDTVKAGQLLAQLDPQDLRLARDSARAALNSARASEALAAADYARYRELLAQGFISQAELERRDATLKSARAALEQARAEASVQGNQTDYASLVADAAGVVTAIEAEPGQVVAAGAPVVRVARDGPRDAVFSVPEDRLALVRPLVGVAGALKVRIWGATETLPATVREVAAATDPTTRTFLVKADLGRADVRLGQTAAVLVDAPLAAQALRLPLAAVFESGGESAVWVLEPGPMTVRRVPIRIAGAEGNEVLVASGLAAGQTVVTAGVHVLTPGQKVRRYTEPATAASAVAASPTVAASR